MDIISIVNTMQPNTISRLAKKREDFHGEDCIPFMGCFVQLFTGARLPSEDSVNAYQPTYNAAVSEAEAQAQAKAALPDLATQVAHLTAFVVNGTPLPDTVLEAVNAKLEESDQSPLTIESAQPAKLG